MKKSPHLKLLVYFFLVTIGSGRCVNRNEVKEIESLSTGDYVGIVRYIDFDKKIIIVRLKEKTNFSIPFDDSTSVWRNNKPMLISDLRFWQSVEIKITINNGKNKLNVIKVME